jgi:hypothetical protein
MWGWVETRPYKIQPYTIILFFVEICLLGKMEKHSIQKIKSLADRVFYNLYGRGSSPSESNNPIKTLTDRDKPMSVQEAQSLTKRGWHSIQEIQSNH